MNDSNEMGSVDLSRDRWYIYFTFVFWSKTRKDQLIPTPKVYHDGFKGRKLQKYSSQSKMSGKVLHALDMQYILQSKLSCSAVDCARRSVIPENDMAFLQMKIGL